MAHLVINMEITFKIHYIVSKFTYFIGNICKRNDFFFFNYKIIELFYND